MEMQRCRRENITCLGFIDTQLVNKVNIDQNFDEIFNLFTAMIRNQHSEEFFLLPYRIE